MPIPLDGVRHTLDAIDPNAGMFMERQLEQIEASVYEFKQRELVYRELIPVSNRDNPGAETITYVMYGKVGMAKVIADYSKDLPRADVYGESTSLPVKSLGVSVGFSRQEIRAAMMAGVDLDSHKAAAQRRAIREKESQIAWSGDSATGLAGFLTNTNIPTLAAVNGTGGTSPWSAKTAAEILTDIRTACAKVRTQSKGVHQADVMLLPADQYEIIAGMPMNSLTDVTILDFISKPGNSFGLKQVKPLYTELENAFVSGTKDGMVLYEKTPENLELRIPMELMLYPMQEKGLELEIPGESRIGGVVVRYPLACLFFTGI